MIPISNRNLYLTEDKSKKREDIQNPYTKNRKKKKRKKVMEVHF